MNLPVLDSRDAFAIEQLNSRYFHALDGLQGAASDRVWTECFTPDGQFRLLDVDGTTIRRGQGQPSADRALRHLPRRRHDPALGQQPVDGEGRRWGPTICYIIAMDIGRMPSIIARTGLYTDDLTKLAGGWRYTNRTLALDPNSPSPS